MDGYDGRYRFAGRIVHDLSCRRIPPALVLQILAQFTGIHRIGFGIDVDEIRLSARLRNSFRRGNKRIGNGDHDVTRLYAGSHEGEPKGVGAASDSDAESGLAEPGKVLFEPLHHRPADEPGALQSGRQDLDQFVLATPDER